MAKKFQFRLEAVRDIRERARDEAARIVSEGISKVVALQQRVDALSEQLRETVEVGRRDRGRQTMEIAALKAQQYYSTWLHGRITESAAAQADVESQLDQARARLVRATANLKAIEKLRERRWRRHQGEIRKEEQSVMDEIAGLMVRRIGHGGGR